MAMMRVWNITDGPYSTMTSQTMMVLGKVLKPGQAVQVDEDRLARAHKVHALVDGEKGALYIGARPPLSYQQMKKPVRAVADSRILDDKGKYDAKRPVPPPHAHPVPVATKAPKEAEKVVLELKDELKVEEAVAVEATPVEAEAEPAEAESEETSSDDDSSHKRKRGGRGRR